MMPDHIPEAHTAQVAFSILVLPWTLLPFLHALVRPSVYDNGLNQIAERK